METVREYLQRTCVWIELHPQYSFPLSGLLMGSAFLSPFFWWGGIAGFTVFLIALTGTLSRREAFFWGTVSGVITFGSAYLWLYSVFPITWIGDFSFALQLGGITWMLLSAALSTGVVYGVLGILLRPWRSLSFGFMYVPLGLILTQILSSLIFSFVQLGPGTSLNIGTTFGYIGYPLVLHGVLGFGALLGGVYMLTFIVGLSGYLLARFVSKTTEHTPVHTLQYALACVMVLILTYFVTIPIHSEPIGRTVVTINTQFSNGHEIRIEDKADRTRMLIDAFDAALKTNAEVIVFPETAQGLKVFGSSENVFEFISRKTDRTPVVIDSSAVLGLEGSPIIEARVYDIQKGDVARVYKEYLVPGGEYIPYHLSFLLSLVGKGETGIYLEKQFAFTEEVPTVENEITDYPGVLFCSEIVSPPSIHTRIEPSIPFIVHPISHAWFIRPALFHYQLSLIHTTNIRMAGLPLVQAANMWESRAYNRLGTPIQGETIFETASTSVVMYEI